MRVRIALETLSSVQHFVELMEQIEGSAFLTDGTGLKVKVNAKSIMGVAYSLEFNEIWLETEKSVYSLIAEYVY